MEREGEGDGPTRVPACEQCSRQPERVVRAGSVRSCMRDLSCPAGLCENAPRWPGRLLYTRPRCRPVTWRSEAKDHVVLAAARLPCSASASSRSSASRALTLPPRRPIRPSARVRTRRSSARAAAGCQYRAAAPHARTHTDGDCTRPSTLPAHTLSLTPCPRGPCLGSLHQGAWRD